MEKGTFVGFIAKGNKKIGLVDGPEGKTHLKVLDQNSISFTVHPREIFFSSEPFKTEIKGFSPSRLNTFLSEVEKAKSKVNLEEVWTVFQGEKAFVNLKDVAELIFSEITLENLYSVYISLEEDKIFFKQKQDQWELKAPGLVQESQKQFLAHQAKLAVQEGLKNRLETALKEHCEFSAEDLKKLETLKKLAVWDEEAPEKTTAFEILQLMGRPKTSASAFSLLVELGIWNKHENLELIRNQISKDFPPEVIDLSKSLVAHPPTPSQLFDAMDQNIFTVDEASTTEIDDGFSVVWKDNDQPELWIHIADPARFIQVGSVLDKEARRRGTSLYLPDQRITMLPECLAEGPMSLREGSETTALSFQISLLDDGSLDSYEIHHSKIKPKLRLTYESAENLLKTKENRDWCQLEQWSRKRKAWRESQGAIEIRMPETNLHVSDTGDEITITAYPDFYSREIVTEMMVLAGEAAGKFCMENQIPVAYRVQNIPTKPDPEALNQIPEGYLREFAKISAMSRSGFSSEPGAHDGLGLRAYVQATSPIRRYLDLWAHFQILSFLETGTAQGSMDDLAILLPPQEETQIQGSKMERNRTKYWFTEYFSRQPKNTQWTAIVLELSRRDETVANVMIEENGLRLAVKMVRQSSPGQRITFKVASADSRKDILNLIQT